MRNTMTGNGNPPKDKPNKKPTQIPPVDDDVSTQDTGNGNPPPDEKPR